MRAETFLEIVGGKRKGFGTALLRLFLRLLSFGYGGAVSLRNFLFDCRFKRIERLGVPVVSVGNLTMGGTGKTPMVSALLRYALTRGKKPAVLSRGYRASNYREEETENPFRRQNDEAAELAVEFPDVPHYLFPNRVRAGKALLRDYPKTDLVVLDDGFQHRRLARDFDIVLIDALDPFGGGIFPAGFLREPVSGLRRADAVILTRADLVSKERREEVAERVNRFAPQAVWAETVPVPFSLYRFTPSGWETASFETVTKAEEWLPFCGLGNPLGFYRMLEQKGVKIREGVSLPDHVSPDKRALARLEQESRGCTGFLTTMKDLVKLRRGEIGGKPVWGVKIRIAFLAGEEEFLCRFGRAAGF